MPLYTEPLNNVESLWAWNESMVDLKLVGKELKGNIRRTGTMETLVCHDMAGGYLPEECLNGCILKDSAKPYIMMHWWYMDIFTYFSHNFVTIPPTGWINQAHNHDVIILGTFITEWKGGRKLCEQFLSTEETMQRTVKQLVRIAKFHHFDGWLINIENKIEDKYLPTFRTFLLLLTSTMRSEIGSNSRIIWYDAVTVHGKLNWQNELNEKNNEWFNITDGIFLNYSWKLEQLSKTRQLAGERNHQVYVGIDCFGRGCYVAIFAPGWVIEQFPPSSHLLNSIRFWERLAGLVYPHKIRSLPIQTNFSIGFNITDSNDRFYNLSAAQLQPFYFESNIMPGNMQPCIVAPSAGDYK
uniref:Mannosyl-glycoprotein endo-beta-N-acetylglucosaminidase n=1 Tax=Syphacia muris TaxID=451379 RepID=A0A0N5ADE0_9BILA